MYTFASYRGERERERQRERETEREKERRLSQARNHEAFKISTKYRNKKMRIINHLKFNFDIQTQPKIFQNIITWNTKTVRGTVQDVQGVTEEDWEGFAITSVTNYLSWISIM